MKHLIPILIILCFSSQVEASKNNPPLAHYINVKGDWYSSKKIFKKCEINSTNPFPCDTRQIPRYILNNYGYIDYNASISFSANGNGIFKSSSTVTHYFPNQRPFPQSVKKKANFKIYKKQGKTYLAIKKKSQIYINMRRYSPYRKSHPQTETCTLQVSKKKLTLTFISKGICDFQRLGKYVRRPCLKYHIEVYYR